MTSTSLANPVTQSTPTPGAANSGMPTAPLSRNHASQRPGNRASFSNHQSDLERLRKLKEEILMGHNPHFYPYPRPDALEALSLRHNPAIISSPTEATHEPTASRANDASRTHADQRLRQPGAPQTSDQSSTAAEASVHKLPHQPSSQMADPSRAVRQDNQETRPQSTTIDAERISAATSPSNYTVTNGFLNGKRPLTPTVSCIPSGRNGLPTLQSLASTNQSTPASTATTAGLKEHGVKPEMSIANAEDAPSSPLVKDELNNPGHKIPPRPNPGGPLGVSIPLSAGSRETIPLNSSRTASSLGARPEPVLLKRSEFEAMEKEKERSAPKTTAVDRDETSPRSAKPGQEGDPVRSRGVQHDVYIPDRSPSPHRTGDTLLATEARPRGVQHDVYIPPPTPPPASLRDSEVTRPKGVARDVHIPPSPSKERDLRARPDAAVRYDNRLDRGGESYRPESERERDRDRDRDRGRDRERGTDTVDVRRPDYRDDDRRGDRYEDIRDSRARPDDRSYPNASRPLPSTVDAKSSDTRSLRLVSPPPRSLVERLDIRDVRPPAADSYRSRDVYDSRSLRGPDRDSLREPLYRVPLSPPRRAPSPGRSVHREPDYRPSSTYSPRPYEPPTQDWPSREDATTYETRRTMWPDEERRREYDRDRVPLDAARRDEYDRRPAYPPAPSRPDPRDWPLPSGAPNADYYRTVDPVKPAYPSSYGSTTDRYPPELAPVSRVRPRSPSPAPPRSTSVGYIPPSRPSHPESEVARNAKRARVMEQLQQGRQPPPPSNQPPHLARQGPDYHPPTRTSSTPAYDDRRDSHRSTSQRSSSPMREIEYPPRPRSPAPPSSNYRPAEAYPPAASLGRYSWDRDGARYASQRI